eukprot:symbB.v1.2.005841.t2/scaffold343.1/size224757/18
MLQKTEDQKEALEKEKQEMLLEITRVQTQGNGPGVDEASALEVESQTLRIELEATKDTVLHLRRLLEAESSNRKKSQIALEMQCEELRGEANEVKILQSQVQQALQEEATAHELQNDTWTVKGEFSKGGSNLGVWEPQFEVLKMVLLKIGMSTDCWAHERW